MLSGMGTRSSLGVRKMARRGVEGRRGREGKERTGLTQKGSSLNSRRGICQAIAGQSAFNAGFRLQDIPFSLFSFFSSSLRGKTPLRRSKLSSLLCGSLLQPKCSIKWQLPRGQSIEGVRDRYLAADAASDASGAQGNSGGVKGVCSTKRENLRTSHIGVMATVLLYM
jgi:hypothetical protein